VGLAVQLALRVGVGVLVDCAICVLPHLACAVAKGVVPMGQKCVCDLVFGYQSAGEQRYPLASIQGWIAQRIVRKLVTVVTH